MGVVITDRFPGIGDAAVVVGGALHALAAIRQAPRTLEGTVGVGKTT